LYIWDEKNSNFVENGPFNLLNGDDFIESVMGVSWYTGI
jgi:hypothetical protein